MTKGQLKAFTGGAGGVKGKGGSSNPAQGTGAKTHRGGLHKGMTRKPSGR